MNWGILLSVFLVATCGLIYELVAGAAASYLVGDSVFAFSTVVGAYLFAMGVGSWLSRYIQRGLALRFVQVQLLVGLLGGYSAALLFLVYGYGTGFHLALYLLVGATGTLVGLEIPLILRILKDRLDFRDLVSQVLGLDYVGALAASLAFPLLLIPHLGLIRTALLFGMINVVVGLFFARALAPPGPGRRLAITQALAVLALLAGGLAGAERLTEMAEESLYPDDILLARTSPHQRIVLTSRGGDLRLYLNGNLQFSSQDEYRYHEALVHPAAVRANHLRRVLILGGGDGLAAREVLRYPEVESVTLVDLDREMTRLFATHPLLRRLNGEALSSPRLQIVCADAFVWLEGNRQRFDLAVVDFPDPSNYALGKLYTTAFYRRLRASLEPGGAAAVQCTSPLFARRSFWCIVNTQRSAGLPARPYHAYVPSFGEWGFTLCATGEPRRPLPSGLRFLTPEVARGLFTFSPDMEALPARVNRLYDQALVRYYEADWRALSQ